MSIAVLTSLGATAQEPPTVEAADPNAVLAERVDELEQAHRILERKLEIEAEKAAEGAKTRAGVSAGEKGFTLKTADNAFVMKFRGTVQFDGRAFPGDDALRLTDTLVLRRIRPTLEATFFDLIDLRLTPDFANGAMVLFDAYADVRVRPWLKLRVGKFKPPVGLERLQSANWIHFIERAAPTSLVPSRDLGIQLHGDIAGGAIKYELGFFNGGVDGAVNEADNNDDKEIAGRIFTHPFRFFDFKPLENFGIGIAASFGRQTGTDAVSQLPSFRSPGQQTFFAYGAGAFANGNRTRLSPQGYLYLGPVGILAEYVQSSQSVTRGRQTTRVDNAAWNTTVSVVVTGEDASYDGVTPKRNFSFTEGRVGAFEIVARYHVLRVDHDAFNAGLASATTAAERATSFGAGVNWYLNRNARVSADFERTWFIGGAVPVALEQNGDRPAENALFARLQVAF
jgi:phosphate-selective porin OprO/OprP